MITEEGNKLIAEYQELKCWQETWEEGTDYWWSKDKDKPYADGHWPMQSPPPYDRSWNWLIPVVKKVLDELWKMKIGHPDDMKANELRLFLGKLDIDLVWKATVAAVEVINKHKQDADNT